MPSDMICDNCSDKSQKAIIIGLLANWPKSEFIRLENEIKELRKRFAIKNDINLVSPDLILSHYCSIFHQISLMEELKFPIELQWLCVLVFLNAEKIRFPSLSTSAEKRNSSLKIAELTKFLKSYSVEPSLQVDLEFLRRALVEHQIDLVNLFAEEEIHIEKLEMMENFQINFFHPAKDLFLIRDNSLKPFTAVGDSRFISQISFYSVLAQDVLPRPLPILSQLPLPADKESHCYLSHNWANGNHEKVSRINSALERRGLVTWFDSKGLKGQFLPAMTKGLSKTATVVIFVTRIYETKINGLDQGDNCYFEFNAASIDRFLVNNRIAAATEKEMVNPNNWKAGGQLKNEIGAYLVIDVSEEEDEGIFEKQMDDLATAICEAIKNQKAP